jgi:hypothetical protein
MSDQVNNTKQPRRSKLWIPIIIFSVSFLILVAGVVFAAWSASSQHDSALPSNAMSALAQAIRTYHKQTGRFPKNFIELNKRIWQGSRSNQISEDGKYLLAAKGHYSYTLHVVDEVTAGIWAVPVGPRKEEAATHFWYLTPDKVECWMGPALTSNNIGVVGSIPSEEQLRWLMMTRQQSVPKTQANGSKGFFSFLPF